MSLQVAQVLKENPTLPRVLQCSDLLSCFRSNQTDLTDFLTKEDTFKNLILIIHKSKDSNIIRLVYNLFTSYNTSLLKMIATSRENTLNLISFFDSKSPDHISKNVIQNTSKIKNSSNHQNVLFMISSCFDILYSAFYNWPNEMYSILNSSIELFTHILTNIDILPVSTFCANIINLSSLSQPFAWLSYRSLMGTFGPGGPIPSSISNIPITTFKEPAITPQQRIPILILIDSYISKYSKESADFSKILLFALPVLLQKSANNLERVYILELSLKLPKSESIMKCCDSILFSDCKDRRLIELSFQYLTLYPPPTNPNNLEILIFDVLNRRTNNFIIVSFLAFFRKQMSQFEMTRLFVERARNIIIYSMKSQKSTLLLRSARIEIVNCINGKEMLNSSTFQIDDFTREDIKRQRANACSSSYDTSRIKYVKEQIQMNDSKQPIFDAMTLWGPKSLVNKACFSSFNAGTKKSQGAAVMAVKRKKIESAFESVEVDDDDDTIDDEGIVRNNDNDDFFSRNDRKSFMVSTNKSFSDLKSITSPRRGELSNRSSLISASSSTAESYLNSSAKSQLANKGATVKNKLKGKQQINNEVFKSRQLASKKKSQFILSNQRNTNNKLNAKNSTSNLKTSEKVGNNKGKEKGKIKQQESNGEDKIEKGAISSSSSTSSLSSMKKNQNQVLKLKMNSMLPQSHLVEVDENDDDNDDDYDDSVQSWNERSKKVQMIMNGNQNKIQASSSLAPEKGKGSIQKLSKTPTKISSSQSGFVQMAAKKVSSTPQRKTKNGKYPQTRNNLIKRNVVH
ncbi:hypothetical protein M9Y10_026459 [Tritrichomonas musculus]|uniref:ELYS-like domain-containing protein n=1 Tax=Tritrichomonas musculus TaxID=1915356 RepID=A0ABR2H7L6_9EUKA